uniref:Uncharacterized protein n=1 Tax=Siphoviridae sp. ctFIm6 TaxID=2827818 RepID=A0A8S5SIZ6_9CAUD|nr:MAG TPA: hypothetical protein [Siphoviridae sp. ctFIm6]
MIAVLVREPAVISFCKSGQPGCKYQRSKYQPELGRSM